MKNTMRFLMFPFCMFILSSVACAGAMTENQLRQKADEIASKLRCPVCQNLSVSDSDSFMANQIKDKVRKMITEGKSEKEITAYFQSKYGDWILLAPPRKGFDLIVWLLPFAGFAAGALALFMMLRGMAVKKQGQRESSTTGTNEQKSEQEKTESTVSESVKKELEKFDY